MMKSITIKNVKFLSALALVYLMSVPAEALLFDRRPVRAPVFSYYVYPIAGQIPGLQKFFGVGGSVSGLVSPETDLTLARLQGPAEHFPSGDFGITIFTILDVPVFWDHLLLSGFYVDLENGGLPETERGIDSDPDETFILLAESLKSYGFELSLSFFQEQLEIYYATVHAEAKPFGFLDADKNFYSNSLVGITTSAQGSRMGLYLDDTDNRRDPRIGYRIQYERYNFPSTRTAAPSYYQDDYNITGYVPLIDDELILVLNKFYGSSTVTKEGTVDRSTFSCPIGAPASCQEAIDEFYKRAEIDAKNGRATTLGGTGRLRGYRANRFVDSFVDFYGIEARWYFLKGNTLFDFFIERGRFEGLQLAAFYERGTVALHHNELWDKSKDSYGFGIRALLSGVIARADLGFSDEESGNLSVFIGYPF